MNLLVILLMLATCPFATIASFTFELINKQVNTYIDVSSQIAFISRKVVVENVVDETIKNYTFIVDDFWFSNLSFIEVVDSQGTYLQVVRDYSEPSQLRYEIYFDHGLYPSTQETLSISTVFIGVVENQPRKIKQFETHSVLFKFNIYFYSMYFTELQTTVLYTGANRVSYVDGGKFKITNDSNSKHGLQYGPYHNMDANSREVSLINYDTTSPFLVVENLNRFIQVSHWGFITITDHISLAHAGPKLEGPFERPIKQDKPDVTRIDRFTSTLPGRAFNIYLKDEIGMISSFTVDDSDETKVEVEIRPRFVLYGGWKTYYELSYSLPIARYLVHEGDTFSLSLPLIDLVFPHLVVKDAQINLVLPEGASFLEVDPYVDLENNTDNRHCSMFDTVCRKVVSLKQHLLFQGHCDSEVRFTYTFSQYLLLTKPMAVAALLYVTLLSMLSISRLLNNTSEEPRSRRGHPGSLIGQAKSERVISKVPTKYVKVHPKKHINKK